MQYKEVHFKVSENSVKDKLIALLDHDAVTGFQEMDNEVIAYFKEYADITLLEEVAAALDVSYTISTIEEKNWNEEWESNFEPVLLDDYCYIRADFHPEHKEVKYEIVITPKMSFGTGHHATTMQMVELMRDLNISGKSVFDFGTGTGILAILAYKSGASYVYGIDNDEWAYKNAVENCERNNAADIRISQSSIEDLGEDETFDIILANINRHILLDTMHAMYERLNPGGHLLLSGILENEDVGIIREAAAKNGFIFEIMTGRSNWAAMQFHK